MLEVSQWLSSVHVSDIWSHGLSVYVFLYPSFFFLFLFLLSPSFSSFLLTLFHSWSCFALRSCLVYLAFLIIDVFSSIQRVLTLSSQLVTNKHTDTIYNRTWWMVLLPCCMMWCRRRLAVKGRVMMWWSGMWWLEAGVGHSHTAPTSRLLPHTAFQTMLGLWSSTVSKVTCLVLSWGLMWICHVMWPLWFPVCALLLMSCCDERVVLFVFYFLLLYCLCLVDYRVVCLTSFNVAFPCLHMLFNKDHWL